MKITDIEQYFDGGTIEIRTNDKIYCFDDRLFTETPYQLYGGYPKDDNSNLIENSIEIQKELIEALNNYDDDYSKVIINIINENLKK